MQRRSRKASPDYFDLRTALLRKGYSLRSWALANNLAVGSVYGAAKGHRNGKVSTQIRIALEEFASA